MKYYENCNKDFKVVSVAYQLIVDKDFHTKHLQRWWIKMRRLINEKYQKKKKKL